MKLSEIKDALQTTEATEKFKKAYVTNEFAQLQKKRFIQLADDFVQIYGSQDREISMFCSPGRSEICGNHTDHNHGVVLAASISLDAIAIVSKNYSGEVSVKSRGYRKDTVSCDDLEINKADIGKSKALIRGIMARFKELGYKIGGFDAVTSSQVLSGSGLSSSAAFEVLICTILNHLYNDGKISPVEIAQISQNAENVHFKKPCGLLDQMTCSVGGFVKIDFKNPEKPVIEKIDFDFSSCGHSLVIVDTKGSHSDLTDEYAAVRREMESVAEVFGKKVLADVDKAVFLNNIPLVREKTSDRAILRAVHFYNDSERVEKEIEALKTGDFERFKSLIIESGSSSYMYNQNVYACKAPKNQPVSLALSLSEELLKGKGAWRVHGGGFAGTIQAFVPNGELKNYTGYMKNIFGEDSCYVLSIRPVGGVKLI